MDTSPETSPGRRTLALDPGEKRVGLAVSDAGGKVALGLPTFQAGHGKNLMRHLRNLCVQYEVGLVIVGQPLTLRGAVGPAAESAASLAQRLRRELKLGVQMWDERLTSRAADRVLQGEKAEQGSRDRVAATLLLQSWLDHRGQDDDET